MLTKNNNLLSHLKRSFNKLLP